MCPVWCSGLSLVAFTHPTWVRSPASEHAIVAQLVERQAFKDHWVQFL